MKTVALDLQALHAIPSSWVVHQKPLPSSSTLGQFPSFPLQHPATSAVPDRWAMLCCLLQFTCPPKKDTQKHVKFKVYHEQNSKYEEIIIKN